MSEVLIKSRQGNVAVFTMNTLENRHNPETVEALHSALDSVEEDKSIKAVILASSSEKNWCLGLDLNWFSSNPSTDQMEAFFLEANRLFRRLVTLNVPVIAQMNGHSFGNGAILACACDFRFMKSDRGYFCFPEVDLSIPFLPSMLKIIEKAMPVQYFNRLALTGRRVGAVELYEEKAIEGHFENAEALTAGVLEFASQFKKQRWIFGENKQRMHKEILDLMDNEDLVFIKQYAESMGKK